LLSVYVACLISHVLDLDTVFGLDEFRDIKPVVILTVDGGHYSLFTSDR